MPITLPTLKDVSEPQAALRAGDWLSELMPLISDVSEGARVWWTGLVERAQDAYATWLIAGPMDRMAVQPDLQVENKYVRLESRVSSAVSAVGCSATDSQARSNLFEGDDLRAAGVSHLEAVPTWRSQREKHHLDANNSSQIYSKELVRCSANGDVNS